MISSKTFQSPQRGLFISYMTARQWLYRNIYLFQSPQRGLFISYKSFEKFGQVQTVGFSPLSGDCLFLTLPNFQFCSLI